MEASTELTEYERIRQPQEISIETEISISPRSLYREIVCPICMDILSQTRAAPDCLHRFCKKCVEKAVKKECPVCRKRLPSQPKSFREDPKFDQLIATIFNGLQQAKSLETNNNTQTAAPECEVVLKDLNGPLTRYIKCPFSTTIEHLCKYLSMRPESSKLPELDKNDKYKLCIVLDRTKGAYEMLPGQLKLNEIRDTYKLDTSKPLEIYFYNP